MQKSFTFNFDEDFEEQDFVVSECNSAAFSFVDRWPDWFNNIMVIYGPSGSGKSAIAMIWQNRSAALCVRPEDVYDPNFIENNKEQDCFIIEDIENINDEASLLHFFNKIKESNKYLLMTAKSHPSNLSIRLPDLKSRLNAASSVALDLPDDELLKRLLLKHFVEKQLKVGMEVIDFLVSRIDRSFSAPAKLVEVLDKAALAQKKNITIPFVRKCMGLGEAGKSGHVLRSCDSSVVGSQD